MTKYSVILIGVVITLLSACEPHRVEYRPQSPFERSMGAGQREDVHLADGTILRFSEAPSQGEDGVAFTGVIGQANKRVENEDGTIELTSSEPADLINHLMHCLRMREYEVIWDQLLAESTRQRYADQEQGLEVFAAVMEDRRVDLGRTLTRVQRGLRSNEARMKKGPNGLLRVELRSSFAKDYRYTKIDMIQDAQGNFRLLRIQ